MTGNTRDIDPSATLRKISTLIQQHNMPAGPISIAQTIRRSSCDFQHSFRWEPRSRRQSYLQMKNYRLRTHW
jgi:hypothetical protein